MVMCMIPMTSGWLNSFRSIRENPDGEKRAIPSNMINCFCMYSDYTPLTLDEWITCDKKRRETLCAEGSM